MHRAAPCGTAWHERREKHPGKLGVRLCRGKVTLFPYHLKSRHCVNTTLHKQRYNLHLRAERSMQSMQIEGLWTSYGSYMRLPQGLRAWTLLLH